MRSSNTRSAVVFTLAFGFAAAMGMVPTDSLASGKASYDAAMSAAKSAQEKAASVHGEWRDTGKLIKQAELAAEKGDFDSAEKLAKKAEFQANMGYEQAIEQKDASPRF